LSPPHLGWGTNGNYFPKQLSHSLGNAFSESLQQLSHSLYNNFPTVSATPFPQSRQRLSHSLGNRQKKVTTLSYSVDTLFLLYSLDKCVSRHEHPEGYQCKLHEIYHKAPRSRGTVEINLTTPPRESNSRLCGLHILDVTVRTNHGGVHPRSTGVPTQTVPTQTVPTQTVPTPRHF
jgi:hypothetical protein